MRTGLGLDCAWLSLLQDRPLPQGARYDVALRPIVHHRLHYDLSERRRAHDVCAAGVALRQVVSRGGIDLHGAAESAVRRNTLGTESRVVLHTTTTHTV